MTTRSLVGCVLSMFITGCAENPPFITVANEPKNHAWWLRAEYHPRGQDIRGIPITTIQKNWCEATEFTHELFPPELLADLSDPTSNYVPSFSISDTFRQSGKSLTTLVGTYETCEQKKGLFILVLDENITPKEVRFLEEFERVETIAILHKLDDRSIEVWWCVGCDSFQTLEWSEKANMFEWKYPEFE